MRKIFKSNIKISHERIKYYKEEYSDSLKEDCKNKCLIEASKEFNNLQIIEIDIDTTKRIKDEYKGDDYFEKLYDLNQRIGCNYYEVRVTGW